MSLFFYLLLWAPFSPLDLFPRCHSILSQQRSNATPSKFPCFPFLLQFPTSYWSLPIIEISIKVLLGKPFLLADFLECTEIRSKCGHEMTVALKMSGILTVHSGLMWGDKRRVSGRLWVRLLWLFARASMTLELNGPFPFLRSGESTVTNLMNFSFFLL